MTETKMSTPPEQPGSLRDPSICRHEDFLDQPYNEVGTGYHDSMLYKCPECSVGVHVSFAKISQVGDFWPAIKTLKALLYWLGVGLPHGRKWAPCITPYVHAPHMGCAGITEEQAGHK